MKIEKSVHQIEQLFKQIDNSGNKYLNHTPLKCPEGCAHCCLGKNISASPLEYLPYSWDLYKTGKLEERFWEIKNSNCEICVLLEYDELTHKGRCSKYQFRGFVCRLFGNAAMVDKINQKRFSGCKILKAQIKDSEKFQIATQKYSPIYSDFYLRLKSVDLEYGSLLYPVNAAIIKSMEIVFYKTLK